MKSQRIALAVLVVAVTLSALQATAQKVSLSRASLSFGNHPVGKSSAALNVILTNSDGATALSIDSIVASGDYTESDDCNGKLAPSASCTLLVSFKPNTTGLVSGTVTLTDDATTSPQLINLSGTGVLPITVSPASLTFPTVTVGKTSAAQTVTVTNQLTNPVTLGFSASADYVATAGGTTPCKTTLAAKASCTIAVDFQPTTAGNINGALTVTQNITTTPQVVTFSGTGSGGSKSPLSFSAGSVNFGAIGVGGSSKRTIFVTNNSASTVTISSVAASGDYTAVGGAVSPCSGALPSSEQCSIDITFKPTQLGAITGAASVSDNASVRLQTLNLSGSGVVPVVVSPTSLTFASQQQGVSSAPQTVTLTNELKATVNLTSIATSGDYLETNNCGGVIAGGASCTIKVVFRPIARTGPVTGALTITSNAKSSPNVVELSGASTGMLTRFAYVANADSNTISEYTVDLSSGQLRSNGYVLAGTGPWGIAVSPSNKFAYVANSGDNTITGYSIDAVNGRLTAFSGAPVGTGKTPNSLSMTPSGGFAYVSNEDGTVSGYAVNATSGALTAVPGSPFSAGLGPIAVAVTAKFVYVANIIDNSVSAYQINATNGALTAVQGSPFTTGGYPSGVAVDPSGSFAYVTSLNDNTVSAYQINASTGALTDIAGSPYATGTGPIGITIDHSGKFVFVANENSANVSAYAITSGSGGLTPVSGSPFATPGTSPHAVEVDIMNQFLCVSDTTQNSVATFTINPASGALKLSKTVSTGFAPFTMAMAGGTTPVGYLPKSAYTLNLYDSQIFGYSIDDATGNITPTAGSPFSTGIKDNAIAVDPSSRFIYVGDAGDKPADSSVAALAINPQTGVLTTGSGSPFDVGGSPIFVTVDPSGRFAFITGVSGIAVWGINSSSGALSPLSATILGDHQGTATTDPSGRFLYQTTYVSANVSAFAINPSTGVLTEVSGSPFATGKVPASVAVDPSGQFVYVTNNGDLTISAYAINPATGALTPVPGSPFPTGAASHEVAVDPSGRFVYVAASSNSVYAYLINPTNGALSQITGSPYTVGVVPLSVAVDPSGRFLYVGSTGNSSMSIAPTIASFAIDPTSGALSPLSGSPVTVNGAPYWMAVTGVIH